MPPNDSLVNPYVDSLGRIANLWLDSTSPLRQKSIEALLVSTGYPEEIIHRALANAFDRITKNNLLKLIKDEEISIKTDSKSIVLHIGAGNVFTSWLHGVVITLLLGHHCWIKPSTNEPVFANLWHQSVLMVDKELANKIQIVPWNDSLVKRAGAVIAYGSDRTIDELRQLTGQGKIFVGYGNKMSVAIVFKEALGTDAYRIWSKRAIQDIEMFDLNGCLSPQILFIEGQDAGLWNSIELLPNSHPKIKMFAKLADIVKALEPFKDQLSCVGIAGSMAHVEPISSKLEDLGVSRFCELGQMQHPPLSWRNGGISLAETLRPL